MLVLLGFVSLPVGAAESKYPATTPDWRLELVAAAPIVNHPSVVCTAPDGRVFVAEDPMDITAPADARLGRILCLHPDGHQTIFAANLHAVFGLQYLEGKLYVLHNPKFTRFTDDQGVGQDRVDLLEQTNPNPWALDWNDHVPANFRLAMDGYFYVAIGDKGLYHCRGRDGSEANLHGGGILRLRPEATELEIFSTGTRNILDVALTAEDEIFTYDNTDEHQWMGRLTHMVDGGFYGYPHDFIPRRPYTLWMMHDFGAGAACGALAYNEDALPAEYRGDLFLADFGKRQVIRVRLERDGANFRVAAHEELFRDMPEDFRPVGLTLSSDGLGLYLCDWQHRDVKEKNARAGRLWKMTWTGPDRSTPKPAWYLPLALGRSADVPVGELLAALSHPSRSVRLTAQRALVRAATGPRRQEPSFAAGSQTSAVTEGLVALLRDASAPAVARAHALWTLDGIDGGQSAMNAIVASVAGANANGNATTSIATPPIAASTEADASVARQAARQLATRRARQAVPALLRQLKHADASLRFHAAAALGRIGETNAIPALLGALDEPDLFARYAVFTALNRLGRARPAAWPAIVAGLAAASPPVREGTRLAVRETFSDPLVTALQNLAADHARSAETREAALRSLAALHHQRPEWRGEWWAYHPAKAPAPERTVAWTGTGPILETLRAALTNHQAGLRLAAVEGLGEAGDSLAAPRLRLRLACDPNSAVRRAALQSLARLHDHETAPLLADLLRQPDTEATWRVEAVRLAPEFGGADVAAALVELLPRAAPASELRLATIEALGRIGDRRAATALRDALPSGPLEERRATLRALGQLRDPTLIPELLAAWQSPDTRVEALAALSRVSDRRALDVYLDGLASADPALREQCRKALAPIRAEALPQLEARADSFSAIVLAELRRVYANDAEALRSPLFAVRPNTPETGDYERYALARTGDAVRGQRLFFNEQGVGCFRCHSVAGRGGQVGPDLTLAGAQFSRAQLIESVLYPSRFVREGYQQIIIETKDDENFAGALQADTADGLTLVDAAGRTNFVRRADVLNRRTSEYSLMPDGLQAGLTLEQFADLIAYLESRKTDGRGNLK